MRKLHNTAYLLSSLLCAAGSLGLHPQPLYAQNTALNQPNTSSAQMETWRQRMMEPRDKKPGCYMTTYPDTMWSTVPCGTPDKTTANAAVTPSTAAQVHPLITGDDNALDYVADSQGSITSATGTLTIANNNLADGFGFVPNEFSIQLNTRPFASSNPGCNYNAGCTGWVQFLIDSGGSIQIQSWFIGYLLNAANTACPTNFTAYAGGVDCFSNLGYMKLPAVLPFLSFDGVKLTGEADKVNNTVTMSLPNGLLVQGVTANSTLGLAGNWHVAEFNVFGNSNGDKTIFNPGTYVGVKLALTDGTTYPPYCVGYTTYTAETTNLVQAACTSPASLHGIEFEQEVPPTVQSLTPNFGSSTGGTTVNLLGQGFTKKMQATFGGKTIALTGCTYTNCTLVTPSGEGVQPFTVSNLGVTGAPLASSDLVTPAQFTYKDAPYGSMSPTSGTSLTTVKISGVGFDIATGKSAVSFTINGVATPAVGLVCSSSISCTMQPPAKPSSVTTALTVPVTMTVDGKTFSLGSFEYLAPPIRKPIPPPCHGTCI